MSDAMAKVVALVSAELGPVRIGELVSILVGRGWSNYHAHFVLSEAIKAGKIQRDGCWVELP